MTERVQHNAKSYGNERNSPQLPIHGTQNWELLQHGHERFSPRHSHATCIFKCPYNNDDDDKSSDKSCIWLTGGYSEPHRTFDLEIEHANSDVWWSEDGAKWNQVKELYGDFIQGVGNWDAKVGGYAAPWYSRYGHSLTALDGDGDGVADDVMVLAGGFNPAMPSNDVWITKDGIVWNFDGFAPWPKRAYHGAAVFKGNLWIIGGTPLSNDVWMGRLVKEPSRDAGYKVAWSAKLLPYVAPWAPRAGLCAVSQLRRNLPPESENKNSTIPTTSPTTATPPTTILQTTEFMYILGGFAAFQEGHPRHSDGARTRNDVWVTSDGVSWERVLPPQGNHTMPWVGRGFHSCTTWHSLSDRSRWVSSDSMMHLNHYLRSIESHSTINTTHPRIFLTGGGYIGRKDNNEVRSLETYSDTWWSYDGSEWTKVNYEEGFRHEHNLYSTNEWTETTLEGKKVYLGKWGHTLEAFYTYVDLDKDGKISDLEVSVDVCTSGGEGDGPAVCKTISAVESRTPALFMIGGKHENGPMVNDVFVSKQGIHCESNGISCGGNGECGPATMGCICHSDTFSGEYCFGEETTKVTSFASRHSNSMNGIIPVVIVLMALARNLFG